MAKRDIITRTVTNSKGEAMDIQMPKLNRVIAPVSEEFMIALRVYEKDNKINETALARKALATFISFTGKTSDSTERTFVGTDKATKKLANSIEAAAKAKNMSAIEVLRQMIAEEEAKATKLEDLPETDDDLNDDDEIDPEEEEEEEPEA